MLTAAQVATGAYMTEYGELYRNLDDVPEDDNGFRKVREVSNYELDEEADLRGEDHEWPSLTHEGYPDDDEESEKVREYHESCVPALFDEVGNELVEEYHYHPERG